MHVGKDTLFVPVKLKNIVLPNRFVRSATYEGLGDRRGNPDNKLADIYADLASNNVGTIITGFCYISKNGRAMHPAQCGIDSDDKIEHWKKIVDRVKRTNPETKIFMQIAHTGRQTLRNVTGEVVVGVSTKKCTYFKQKVHVLSDSEIEQIISDFVDAALRAQQAGFDGVQVHAAHGYLIHQFLSPYTNTRKDKWSDKSLFLLKVLESIKEKCGDDFPVLVKFSHGDDRGMTSTHTLEALKIVQHLTDAAEISYGTMEYALNIIRGDCPIDAIFKINPMFNRIPKIMQKVWSKTFMNKYLNKLIPFNPNYNLQAAIDIKQQTEIPVFVVGGIRDLDSMTNVINKHQIDAVSLCRPFICEPDLITKIKNGNWQKSICTNCNLCTIYCDSNNSLNCYMKRRG